MNIRGVDVKETYAEAFPMYISRVLITAMTERWALASAQEAQGLGTTAIFCPTEAGIECVVPQDQTPDNRPGVILQVGHQKKEKVVKWLPIRIRHCILSVATTACFDALPQEMAEEVIEMESTPPQLFGAGYEEIVDLYGRKLYKIPLMGGWFYMETKFGVTKGVAGGNFLILGESLPGALTGAEVAVDAIKHIPNVFSPAVNGIFASGSTPIDTYPWATTNYRYCACIADKVEDTQIPPGVSCVLEIVVNGLTMESVKEAMRAGIEAATKVSGVKMITAANYGGNLGPYKIHLHELFA